MICIPRGGRDPSTVPNEQTIAKPAHRTFADHACDLAGLGWFVFPLVERKARLGVDETGSRWGSSTDPVVIRERFKRVRGVDGVGIAAGESNLLVLDVDTTDGHEHDGLASLAEMEATCGTLPPTVAAVTPSGGRHHYFRGVSGIKNSAGKIGLGLDIRAEGGFIVAPPSLRKRRGRHAWIRSPFEHEIAEAPAWLVFAAMFHNERRLLAALGIQSHEGLAEVPVDQWRAQADGLIAADREAKAAAAAQRAAQRRRDRAAQVIPDERARVDGLAWQLLDGIASDLAGAPAGGRNTLLSSLSAKAGMLAGHEATRHTIAEGAIIDRLMSATVGWGAYHPDTRRRPTIERGVAEGVAMAARGECGWLDAATRRAMGRLELDVVQTDEPGANVVERLPVEAARKGLREKAGAAFEAIDRWHNDPESYGNMIRDRGPAVLLGADTGLGKTAAVIGAASRYRAEIMLGGGLVHFAPTTRVAEEIAERYREAGFRDAKVYRGRLADDPDREGHKMCAKHKFVALAQKHGVGGQNFCDLGGRFDDGRTGAPCEHYDTCAYLRQADDDPDVWVVPSALLTSEIALDGLPAKPWAVVVDETFSPRQIVPARRKAKSDDRGLYLRADELPDRPLIRDEWGRIDNDASSDLGMFRGRLQRAAGAARGRFLTRDDLEPPTSTSPP